MNETISECFRNRNLRSRRFFRLSFSYLALHTAEMEELHIAVGQEVVVVDPAKISSACHSM